MIWEVAKERNAEANGAAPMYVPYVPKWETQQLHLIWTGRQITYTASIINHWE